MVIKFIYTIFLALLIALFVGFGIDAFYPAPEPPTYPAGLEMAKPIDCQDTAEEQALKQEREEYNKAQEKFSDDLKIYNRNVSIISLIAAIIILISSLTLLAKIKMIADGILLGGVFATVYAIIRGLMSESSVFRFIIITIGLIIALILGYIKFIRAKND